MYNNAAVNSFIYSSGTNPDLAHSSGADIQVELGMFSIINFLESKNLMSDSKASVTKQ